MKKSIFSLLALGAMTFGLASCNSSNSDNSNASLGEGIGYMSFTISRDAARTASAQSVGESPNESTGAMDDKSFAVCPNNLANAALFFDNDGRFYGMSNLHSLSFEAEEEDRPDSLDERFFTYITRWGNASADTEPSQVILLLNANPEELDKLSNMLWDEGTAATSKVRDIVYDVMDDDGNYLYGVYNYSGKDYFTMSNSSLIDALTENIARFDNDKVCIDVEEALNNPVAISVAHLFDVADLQNLRNSAGQKNNVILESLDEDNSMANEPQYGWPYSLRRTDHSSPWNRANSSAHVTVKNTKNGNIAVVR